LGAAGINKKFWLADDYPRHVSPSARHAFLEAVKALSKALTAQGFLWILMPLHQNSQSVTAVLVSGVSPQ